MKKLVGNIFYGGGEGLYSMPVLCWEGLLCEVFSGLCEKQGLACYKFSSIS